MSKARAEAIAAKGHAEPRFIRRDLRDVVSLQKIIAKVGCDLALIRVLVDNAGNDDRRARLGHDRAPGRSLARCRTECQIAENQCLKEKVYPPDIARMVLWLAADDSRLRTAQNLVGDAGWT